MASPTRAFDCSMTQPMAGPPIGVEPRKATAHKAMTRPRIEGSDPSCRVELPVARNETLPQPTSAMAP